MSNYKASDELAYTSEQNRCAIESGIKDLEEYVQNLRTMLEANVWNGYQGRNWTDGYVGRDVARMSSMIARQQALSDLPRLLWSHERQVCCS